MVCALSIVNSAFIGPRGQRLHLKHHSRTYTFLAHSDLAAAEYKRLYNHCHNYSYSEWRWCI